uniref:Uncharacterized protein n=1 Tax=Arundo donax TaxID=35708 RepID=A0A0A9FDW7_ARUDO
MRTRSTQLAIESVQSAAVLYIVVHQNLDLY